MIIIHIFVSSKIVNENMDILHKLGLDILEQQVSFAGDTFFRTHFLESLL